MSRIQYDFVTPKSDIYQFKEDTTIKAHSDVPKEKIEIGAFLESLHKFSASLNYEDNIRYQQACIAAKTTTNNQDSNHLWFIISQFFIQSLRQTYPDKELDEIEEQMKVITDLLLPITKNGVDNEAFRVYILGMLSALL